VTTVERAAIRAQDLVVSYGDTVALDGLDLAAPAEAVTALVGPNGAGKTTFVHAVATLLRVRSGRLTVASHDVTAASAAVRRCIGLAGQHAAIVDKLTGRENMMLVARLCGLTRSDAREATRRVIAAHDLSAFVDQRVETCSGGQRRRLDLAATLVGDPHVLLLDEPTTGLDPRSRTAMWHTIRGLPEHGVSVLLTTQSMEEASTLADHVVVIDGGRAVASGSPAQLRRATRTTSLHLVTTGTLSHDAMTGIAQTLDAKIERRDSDAATFVGSFRLDEAHEAVHRAALSSHVTEFLLQPPSLEQIVLSLTDAAAEPAT
jgi:oleandomycin transport system ATP-binding protein